MMHFWDGYVRSQYLNSKILTAPQSSLNQESFVILINVVLETRWMETLKGISMLETVR